MLPYIKIGKEILTFVDIETGKHKCYCQKNLISLEEVDIDNVSVSNKISSGKKKIINTLLVTYVMIIKIKPLHEMLPKMRMYVKSYDGQTKWMYFLTEDDDLLNKSNTI